jgi:hypothetical protein
MSRQVVIERVEAIIGYVFPEESKDTIWAALQFNNTEIAIGGDIILKLVIIQDLLVSNLSKGRQSSIYVLKKLLTWYRRYARQHFPRGK